MLFLRLPASGTEALQAVSCIQGHWQRLAAWQTLDELARWYQGHRGLPVTLVTPAGLDIALVLEASARQRREAGTDLISLAEESLAEDYERLHWTLDSLDESHVLARGISLAWLESWLTLLREREIQPKVAIPEAALLHADRDSWVWLPAGEGEVFLQAEPGQAALISQSDAGLLLEQLYAQRSPQTPVRLRYPQGCDLPALPAGVQPAAAPWRDWADLLKTQTAGVWSRHPQNWLSGSLAPRTSSPWSPWWRAAVATCVLAVLVQTVADRYEAHRLNMAAAQARGDAEQLYRGLFPDDRRITDLERQFSLRLKSAGGVSAPEMLQLLAQTAPTPQWQVQKLEYRQSGSSSVEISGGALGEVQAWAGNLSAQGLNASVQNARLESGQARARLVINAGPAGR